MNAQAHNDVVAQGPVAVIFRRDAAGNKVGFLQQSLDLSENGGKLEVWHGKGRTTNTVPLSYYHATTKLSDADEIEMGQKFATEYKPTYGIVMRKRLAKEMASHPSHPANSKSANETLRRSSDTQEQPFDKDLYVQKLQLALETSLRAAFKVVNEEMGVK